MRRSFLLFFATVFVCSLLGKRPNILWIITDDQRPDSLQCYNEATRGERYSELGPVLSPNVDALARDGVLFTNAYCNSPACAPSRASMHTGQYPFRNGIYGFEQTHDQGETYNPIVPQVLKDEGYQTARFGKSGLYIFEWGPGLTWNQTDLYQLSLDQKKDFQWTGITDYVKDKRKGRDVERWFQRDGSVDEYFFKNSERDATRSKVEEQLDILRFYPNGSEMIMGGESPQGIEGTLDAREAQSLLQYLSHPDSEYVFPSGRVVEGPDSEKPLFLHLGFNFPHTPVLPPREFREQFSEDDYTIPEFDSSELDKLPPQLRLLHKKQKFDTFSEADKKQAIRDYYAFCAYGDTLVGKAVEGFKLFCEERDEEYLILYVCGDHSWHLGENGLESKFGPYDQSNHNAVIAVSSDKDRFPPGTVSHEFVEFVDFAPTLLEVGGVDTSSPQFEYLDGTPLWTALDAAEQKREYVLGYMNHVYGPRGFIRNKDFSFSMRTRPNNGKPGVGYEPGQDIRWALETDAKSVEMTLFDLRVDPKERANVAYDNQYRKLAAFFREKLGNIVLGDRRLEVDWHEKNDWHLSEFALGSDDKKLRIPAGIVPEVIQ